MSISWEGMNIGIALLAPSVLFLLLPSRNMPEALSRAGVLFTVLEWIGRLGALVLLAFTHFGLVNFWALLMALCLFLYYLLWILRYYLAGRDYRRIYAPLLGLPVPLAWLPALAICFAALWAKSWWLGLFGLCFAAGHLVNSMAVYRQL